MYLRKSENQTGVSSSNISIMQTEIQQADPDPDGMNEFLNGAKSGYSAAMIL